MALGGEKQMAVDRSSLHRRATFAFLLPSDAGKGRSCLESIVRTRKHLPLGHRWANAVAMQTRHSLGSVHPS